MSVHHAHSSFADSDWLPVVEALMRGTHHALSNRVAALDGIVSLQEMGLTSREESQRSMRDEMIRLRGLLALMRGMTPKTIARREPGQLGDALRLAAALLVHRDDARQVSVEIGDESEDAEPVMLWPADRLRAMVLLLVAASDAAEPATVLRATIRGVDHRVHVLIEGSINTTEASHSPAYQALGRFVGVEAGSCACDELGSGAARVTLVLPGMSRAATP